MTGPAGVPALPADDRRTAAAVQIEGLAMGFGAGYLFAIGYLVAEAAGAPPLDVTFIILVMTAGWLIGNVVAMRHYQ